MSAWSTRGPEEDPWWYENHLKRGRDLRSLSRERIGREIEEAKGDEERARLKRKYKHYTGEEHGS